ncbi:hypothetical protein [Paenibacillus taichungensis]|uniref:hypothetical protein n=1 Tax=Paenibacillus taichungensis TaxID=484184 RepID=UPI0015C615C9|nr:hypothetical protein [Paenibacillus taichungensis]
MTERLGVYAKSTYGISNALHLSANKIKAIVIPLLKVAMSEEVVIAQHTLIYK